MRQYLVRVLADIMCCGEVGKVPRCSWFARRADNLLMEARDRVTRLRKAGNEFDLEAMIRRASVELFSDTNAVLRCPHGRTLARR